MRKSGWVGNFKIIYIILNFLVFGFPRSQDKRAGMSKMQFGGNYKWWQKKQEVLCFDPYM